jgi:hypothetical protein
LILLAPRAGLKDVLQPSEKSAFFLFMVLLGPTQMPTIQRC